METPGNSSVTMLLGNFLCSFHFLYIKLKENDSFTLSNYFYKL